MSVRPSENGHGAHHHAAASAAASASMNATAAPAALPHHRSTSSSTGEITRQTVNDMSAQLSAVLSAKAKQSSHPTHHHQPSLAVGMGGLPMVQQQQDQEQLANNMDRLRIQNEEQKKKSSSSSKSSTKKSLSYAAERVIGNGSFGVVYQASVIDTGETVAIKKVLQDRRFKNRELDIMSTLDHPNVVQLRHCFYSRGEKDDVYLNLVMEYIPETIHRTLRNHTKANKLVPPFYVKLYMYQLARSVAYIHAQGVCHRDIKPQNVLLNTKTSDVKLCDFGSAKCLVKGEPNVSYICSRYYRAPELVFEATEYTTAIDTWSVGCVFGELLLGSPLFPGESGVGQLIEIIKVLGSPSKEEVLAMNPNHSASFRFPSIKPQSWAKVFRNKASEKALDLISKWLRYKPTERLTPLESLAHPFFDELREAGLKLPNGRPLPPLFNFTPKELKLIEAKGLTKKLIPSWYVPTQTTSQHISNTHHHRSSSNSSNSSSSSSGAPGQ